VLEVLAMDNREIARHLVEHAHALEAREASLYRARAYRRAAETVQALDRPLSEIYALEGREGLEEVPTIGPHIAEAIESLLMLRGIDCAPRGCATA
jgi:DNA polymerase/3'-5' exonuclease PolX